MVIVDYHYIRDNKRNEISFPAVSIKDFSAQLDFLQKNYKIVNVTRLAELKEKGETGKYASIVFDDGIIDHYRVAFPALVARGLEATFFPTASIFEGKVPLVTKMHVVFAKTDSQVVAKRLEQYLRKNFSSRYDNFTAPAEERIAPKKRIYDDVLTANLKEIIARLKPEIKEDFTNALFGEIIKDEEKFYQSIFISADNLKEMFAKGMTIGSHSYGHNSLASLNPQEARLDILKSKEIIEGIIKGKIDEFSYPFGDYNNDTITILKDLEFKCGVVYARREILPQDTRYTLSSGDFKDLFNGKEKEQKK